MAIVLGLLAACLLLSSSTAVAAECTDTWTGAAEGSWGTASNWSAAHAPGEADVTCIGAGKTVKMTAAGTASVQGLQGEGTLTMRESTLKLLGTGETWRIGTLKLDYQGLLTGAGTLEITKGLSWESQSTMSGTGQTILGSSAVSTIGSANSNFTLSSRRLINEGTITQLAYSTLAMGEGGVFENLGTYNANGENSYYQMTSSGMGSGFVNKGTFRKTAGAGNYKISATLENLGTFAASTGKIIFQETSQVATFADGSQIEGAVSAEKASVTLNSVVAPKAVLWFRETTVKIPSGKTASVGNLALSYKGNIVGPGNLEVTKGLAWEGQSTMSGGGETVLGPSALSTIGSGNVSYTVSGRRLVNEGTITQLTYSTLTEAEGGVFENLGTYNANGESSLWQITSSGVGSKFVNKGTFRKTAGTGSVRISSDFENFGTFRIVTGKASFVEGTSHTLVLGDGSNLEGSVGCEGIAITLENVTAPNAELWVRELPIYIPTGKSPTLGTFKESYKANLSGGGNLEVTKSFVWEGQSTMGGTGKTVLPPGTSNVLNSGATMVTLQRTLINEGSFNQTSSSILNLNGGGTFKNRGTYSLTAEPYPTWMPQLIRSEGGGSGRLSNTGLFQRTEGKIEPVITAEFENLGVLKPTSSKLKIEHPVTVEKNKQFGTRCHGGDPVECATGNFTENQTDVSVGGLGIGLDLTRSYSAQAAAAAVSAGPFGYGWTASFSDHLTVAGGGEAVTLTRSNGSTVPYTRVSGTTYAGPAWSQETLTGSPESGYTFIRIDQVQMHFSGTGRLESIVDRNGNETTLSYDPEGRLQSITDPSGRQLTLAYNVGGQVKSVEDPMGHVVSYAYESGNLASVTLPGGAAPRWQFKYDASHRITLITDGRGGKTSNEYDGSSRVISQTDPAERTLIFKYEPFHTTITNKATGAVTDEWFTSNNEPFSITHGYGTVSATTETFAYDEAGRLIRVTDGNGHSTTYEYDVAGNRTVEKDAVEETKWTYNATHDVTSITTPVGETTTIERDANGNVESIASPGPGATTQTTRFSHDEHGQLASVTDPLERTWSYGYDSFGDRTSEVSPLGDERSWSYDEDSQVIATVSPRGHLEGAEPSEYQTSVERDPQGRPVKVTDPLGASTEYVYDGNGNVISVTDTNGNTTKYVYNGDDEPTKVEKPSGAVLGTGYDGAGFITSQTDGNKGTTTYVRNVLGQPVEVIDPLNRKTTAEFDAVGNPVATVDAAGRKTTFAYDAANKLTKLSYSEEATPSAEFEYDPEGDLVRMVDGTGESSFVYDQLGRLTRSEDGNGDSVEYQYDLADELTGIVYPNGKEVARSYDAAGRLESVSDWLGGTTGFTYDADSNVSQIAFPSASGNVDEYVYDQASRMSGAKFKTGAETVASLSYVRDPLGLVEEEARAGLPGPEAVAFGYDKDNRLIAAGGSSFEYDNASNMTKGLGSTNAYDAASQLETGPALPTPTTNLASGPKRRRAAALPPLTVTTRLAT